MKMKKAGLLVAFAMIMQSVVGICGVSAAKPGSEKVMFYDFNNYSATPGSHEFPDEYWGAVDNGHGNYGSAYDSDLDSTVLRSKQGAWTLLYFGELFNEGKLHVSFDMRVESGENPASGLVRLYDGRGTTGPMEIVPDPKTGYNDIASNVFTWSANDYKIYYLEGWMNGGVDMISWRNNVLPPVEADATEWHHFDLTFGEMTEVGAQAWYYMDGVKMNSNPIYFTTGSKGFKALQFNVTGGDMYLDNVYVHRYYDSTENLIATINGGEGVETVEPTLDIKFCEKVSADDITEDKIVIERSVDGYKISDFEILSKDDQSVKIKVNETLQSGLYTFKAAGLTGVYTGCVMNKAIDFRTAFQTKVVEKNYSEDDFNDYTAEDNAYPSGWLTDTNDNTSNPAVRAIERAEGNVAFGMQVTKQNVRRPYYQFEEEIEANKEINVEFDVYTDGAEWGFYLLNSEPRDSKNMAKRDEIIIGGTANDSALKYASAAMTTCDSKFNDACVVTPDEWHTVSLRIIPDKATSTTLKVKVDGGTEYTATVNRDFTQKSVKYMALGVKGASSEEGSTNVLYIDNLSVKSQGVAYKPEVDQIVLKEYTGDTYKTSETIPVGITDIDIRFNTEVKSAGIESFVKLKQGGADVSADYEMSGDKKTLTLKLPTPLESDGSYTISVLKGIETDISSDIKSEVDFVQNFKTPKTADFYTIYNNSIESGNSFKVNMVKTDASSNKYTAAICGYELVNDGTKDFELMKSVKLVPIELKTSDTGYFEFETDELDADTYDVIRAYIFEYPSMQLVTVVTK